MGSCKSWYQNKEGTVIALWPKSTFKYWWITRSINFKEEFFLDPLNKNSNELDNKK